jgi:hypothetical protein
MPSDVSKFLSNLKAITPQVMERARKRVGMFGAMVVGNAQQLAPVEYGVLKASGTWSEPVVSGTLIEMEIGFNTNYAAAVHERLDVRHDQGQAKYLEIPMKQLAPKFNEFVGRGLM